MRKSRYESGFYPETENGGGYGTFHCPLGALAFGDDGCIQCGLCSAVTRAEKIAATQKMRAWIRENRQSSNPDLLIQKIAVCGTGGSGKSTLASVIAGFSHPSTGSILVNGVPSLLESVAWRSRLSYIPQSPYLFAGTLRENIAFYCPQASEEAVLEAAEKAGLSELLERLPEGLNTLVGEGGRALSGGQAQRVALARAFLDKRRSVLIFDEPTAHLDIETEYELKEQMLPLMQDKLVFFATHRLHWLRNMDYILMLENGCVVEQGTLNDLLAKNGAFARFVEHMQGGGAHDETA